ncbi:dihydrofolate reductase family protein [Microbacterium esteraromaticum]|uniref:Dihydrofolate reductase family protein n=1 Tax=Microbacterium esteraromaticum TaxID=57043 RepID=A0A7D8AJP5_9MICO|nr:dihydrofolate reductase family protein [Microbacterium esteraromaticum]QMU97129.1 dihydrofolate reductase family protein [Microbacterium esteraromaticum]
MGNVIYSMIVSQDGYVADADGDFSWAQPTEEALASVNEEMSEVGTFLYGRRMYDMMAVWETDPAVAAQSAESARFAEIWKRTDKVVYSREPTSRTGLRQTFDPAEIARLKEATARDLTVDGPTLAAEAIAHGLVDRISLLICPVTVGGGLAFWPKVRMNLELRRLERFGGGVVHLSYDVPTSGTVAKGASS